MKKLIVVKTGTTFPATKEKFGDFDKWTAEALGSFDLDITIVDVELNDPLPTPDQCAGVTITGSHAMVTDDLPWSLNIEKWITELLKADVPIFGICYGHQLLARAAGGTVGYHPQGKEVGTVTIQLLNNHIDDPLFCDLPQTFKVHATHAQSVLRLPDAAVLLARNPYEAHHAFRIGKCAWGVQFHPEYSPKIMRSYIEHQTDVLQKAGQNTNQLLTDVSETPVATELYQKFGQLVLNRLKVE